MSDALDCAPYAISSTYPKGKVFSNHTHVALSSSLTIFILFFSFDSSQAVNPQLILRENSSCDDTSRLTSPTFDFSGARGTALSKP